MWQYNYTNQDNELYHYGVKGMKWKNNTYATREELEAAKKKYKDEKKEFKADRNAVYKELKKNKTVISKKNISYFRKRHSFIKKSLQKILKFSRVLKGRFF